MKRAFLVLTLLAVAVPAAAREFRGPPLRAAANPSAVIARELAFAQAAQNRGQWTAFREFAAPDAVMFAPAMVMAQAWLKDRANPPKAVRWQPVEVWSSCDGTLVVSHGAWQRETTQGWFTTIWQRQDDGSYKWVLDHGDVLQQPLAAPEMIPAHVADCPPRKTTPAAPPPTMTRKSGRQKPVPIPFDPAHRAGRSADGSITWEVTASPDGAHHLSIEWATDGQRVPLLVEQVAAENP